METTQIYKGYYIDYSSLTGSTIIRGKNGLFLKKLIGFGELKGEELAKDYIDSLG